MVTGSPGANELKEIKVGSHEFSGNEKIVTHRWFPMTSGRGTEKLLSMGFEILGLENNRCHLKLSVIV